MYSTRFFLLVICVMSARLFAYVGKVLSGAPPQPAGVPRPGSLLAYVAKTSQGEEGGGAVTTCTDGPKKKRQRKKSGDKSSLDKEWIEACSDEAVSAVLSSDCCPDNCLKTKATFRMVQDERKHHCAQNAAKRRQECRDFMQTHHDNTTMQFGTTSQVIGPEVKKMCIHVY